VLRVINPATEELLAELEEDDARTLAQKTAAALQINFALWGMLICASLELAQMIERFF